MSFNPKLLSKLQPSTLFTEPADIPAITPQKFVPQFWMYNSGSDTIATVEASGYFYYFADWVNTLIYNDGQFFQVGDIVYCVCSNGSVQLTVDTLNPITTSAYAVAPGTITGDDLANPLTTTAGITTSTTTASATPGTIRAWTGKITETNTTMTSGNITGLRGEVDMKGASGGFAYGVQGKVIPTGTLSGSVWAPAVFGQYDLSAATLNSGQIAAVWGDMGASGGTFTNVTGARMFAGTNTIASLTLNAMDYRYGKASNLLELAGDAGTYITTGGATASGTIKKIAILIDGVQYYLQAATVYS
jgi:hypothetical protein